MFDEYQGKVAHGEDKFKFRVFGVKMAMFGVLCVVSLVTGVIYNMNSKSLEAKLAANHKKADARFVEVYENKQSAGSVYAITYVFSVNGLTYKNTSFSKIKPSYPNGVAMYNPDNPEESMLEPISSQ
ncbi:MAG TPA: hypothetical protein PKA82_10425 [Pyrinomonadaceae bacterium]|nr:hypothetical protein [Pyrinomonadaceae bacterium]